MNFAVSPLQDMEMEPEAGIRRVSAPANKSAPRPATYGSVVGRHGKARMQVDRELNLGGAIGFTTAFTECVGGLTAQSCRQLYFFT